MIQLQTNCAQWVRGGKAGIEFYPISFDPPVTELANLFMVLAVHWSVGNVDDFLTMRHSLASSTSGTVDYITNGEDPGLKTDNLYLSRKSRDTSDRAAGETVYLLASSQHTLYDIRVYLLLCVQCYS